MRTSRACTPSTSTTPSSPTTAPSPTGSSPGKRSASGDGHGAERPVLRGPPGQALCPYHYEYEEEWLLVTNGAPTLRDPEGEHQLRAGDLVCFSSGPDGVHQVINRTDAPAHVMMWSSAREPAVAVYPDSDKIGIYTPDEDSTGIVRRRDTSVDYWEDETAPS